MNKFKGLVFLLIAAIVVTGSIELANQKIHINQLEGKLVSTETETVIKDGIYHELNKLRYDSIKNYCKEKGINVTNEDIDKVILNVAENNDKAVISKESFLLTLGHLDMRFNEMLWPATHNSFSNDPDGTSVVTNYLSKEDTNDLGLKIVNAGDDICTENHKLSIKDQLGRGIRCIDVDLGPRMNIDDTIITGIGSLIENAFKKGWEGFVSLFKQGSKKPTWDWKDILGDIKVDWSICESYHRIGFLGRTSLNTINGSIKNFLDNNPNEIAVIRVSDLYDGVFGTLTTDDEKFYLLLDKFLDNLKSNGLLSHVANYYGNDSVAFDKRHEYVLYPGDNFNGNSMEQWPMIKDMVLSDKRLVLILPTFNKIKGDSSTVVKNTDNATFTTPPGGKEKPYAICVQRIDVSDSKAKVLKEAKYRVLKIDPTADDGISAGSYEHAKQNNNGRRIYDLVKAYNKVLADKGVNRVVNFIGLDYFMGDKSKGGIRDVDVVDAANRVNFENMGRNWEDINSINKNLYWNYFNKNQDLGIINNISSADSNIDGYKGDTFIDKNVWTGTESQNIKGKYLKVKFDKEVMIDSVHLNFFSYEDAVPFEVKIMQNGVEYNVGSFEIKQNRLADWYEVKLGGSYKCSEASIYFKGDRGVHFKEVAFTGKPIDTSLKTNYLIPTDDSYVIWGNNIGKNYHYDDYHRQNLEMYHSSINARAVFMKFDMKDFRNPTKYLERAYMIFKVTDLDKKVDISIKEDRDASDWKESELTGNIAKHKDSKAVKYFYIQSNGYVKVDVTDGIRNYIESYDQDNKMTLRFYTNTEEWFVIKSKETSDPPKLEMVYRPVVIDEKTVSLLPEQDVFVKWGGNSKYNYSSDRTLNIYKSNADSKNSQTSFMKFGLDNLINKKIIKAELQYTLQVGDPTVIAIREDVDANNWTEETLNGNKAKYFDKYNMIASSLNYNKTGTYKVDVTNLIADFVKRGDEDKKITFRFYQPKHSAWTYIHDRKSQNPPKLIITYSE